jgi:hypothetical protein
MHKTKTFSYPEKNINFYCAEIERFSQPFATTTDEFRALVKKLLRTAWKGGFDAGRKDEFREETGRYLVLNMETWIHGLSEQTVYAESREHAIEKHFVDGLYPKAPFEAVVIEIAAISVHEVTIPPKELQVSYGEFV